MSSNFVQKERNWHAFNLHACICARYVGQWFQWKVSTRYFHCCKTVKSNRITLYTNRLLYNSKTVIQTLLSFLGIPIDESSLEHAHHVLRMPHLLFTSHYHFNSKVISSTFIKTFIAL